MREFKDRSWLKYAGNGRYGRDLVIYSGVSASLDTVAVDVVREEPGDIIIFRQVYPNSHFYVTGIRGYYGKIGYKAAQMLEAAAEEAKAKGEDSGEAIERVRSVSVGEAK